MTASRYSLISFALLVSACGGATSNDVTDPTAGEEDITAAPGTVERAVSTSCSTSAVHGLAQQLVDEVNCMSPDTLGSIDNLPGVNFEDVVFPYLQTPAARALAKAGARTPIHVNSALRTIPQQYLLFRWAAQHRCGIALAAHVGHSNHEQGLAVDIQEEHTSAMTAAGFRWFGSADPVHNDYVGGGSVDLAGLDTKAFQRLWNRNHPNDKISEDGDYGPETESRVKQSPAAGFAQGASCN
jgi:hypothetical protein